MIYKNHELRFLIVIVLVTFFSCKKDPVWTATIDSPFQFKAVIDGSIVSYAGFQSVYTIVKKDSINGFVNITYFVGVGDNYQNSTISTLKISKGTLQLPFDSLPTYSEMQQFILSGTNNYSNGLDNGIQVTYTDKEGITWSTSYGSGKQSNESFEIVSSKMEQLTNGDPALKCLIKFNCTLYGISGGSIGLTDGLFIGDFANYY